MTEVGGPETVEVPGLGMFERVVRRSSGGAVGGPYRAIEWASWEASVQWRGLEVAVRCEEDETPVTSADLVAAGGRVLAFLEREEGARCEVAAAMLGLAQDWWYSGDRGVDEPPLTLDVFQGLMRLDAIVIEQDGGLSAYYDDNEEVFAGHAIQASFDADGTLTDTDIPG